MPGEEYHHVPRNPGRRIFKLCRVWVKEKVKPGKLVGRLTGGGKGQVELPAGFHNAECGKCKGNVGNQHSAARWIEAD